MSNFPSSIDNDSTIPTVYDNITEIGAEAINALKEAVLNIEEELGTSCSGSVQDLSTRLNVSLNPDGTIKSSAITSLGLVSLPINDSEVATNAEIQESKLLLDHSTQSLFNSITSLGIDVTTALNWININGTKITQHIAGGSYNHYSNQILVTSSTSNYLKNKYNSARDNSELYSLISDINSELVEHQQYDGYGVSTLNVITNSGLSYPDNFAHHSAGLFVDSSRFVSIPSTINNLQALAEFVDTSSLLLFGTRVQNFFSNGVSNSSRSSTLINDGYSQILIESVLATTFLRNNGSNTSPVDDINNGDDIIELKPSGTILTSNLFDAQFSQVRAGDNILVNYGSAQAEFIVKEKKYIESGGTKKFIVRINGTNLLYSTTASVVISRPQYNTNKKHVLALGQAYNSGLSVTPSLTCIHPRSASVIGIGFNANLLDSSHYNLYLQIYPNGNLSNVQTLPAIDVTGNLGATPGKYTLESVIQATNNAFRSNLKNYRFVAFDSDGEFGIALSDPYSNTYFSIINAVVDSSGSYNQSSTVSQYVNNVIDVFTSSDSLGNPQLPKDALGLGIYAANFSSPPYSSTYSTAIQALTPTKIFVPLKKNFYYVNGSERDQFALEVDQTVDQYGDGYWLAEITSKNIIPGIRNETTYRVELDLKSSGLKVGKTLVIQPMNDGYFIDSGRFIISDVTCVVCSPTLTYTDITVYDATHGQSSYTTTSDIGSKVKLYFGYDSISFNTESATDNLSVSSFKRFFEVYVNSEGKTFSHERARFAVGGSDLTVNGQTLHASSDLENLSIYNVSKKLKGYSYGNINKISIYIESFIDSTGMFTGYLTNHDGVSATLAGPITIGYLGEVVRFYDNSNIDYIEFKFDVDLNLPTFVGQYLDVQLFPSLELDQEVFLIGNCFINSSTNEIESLVDRRDFGNVSEQNFTTSAIDFISLGEKYLHTNGVIDGFGLDNYQYNVENNQISLSGGTAIINGKYVIMNPDVVEIPLVKERYSSVDYNVLWAVCLNDKKEYVTYPLLDVKGNGNYYSSQRIFTAFNPKTSTTYRIESITKSKLLSRKDLCLLYIVNSIVAGTPVEATLDVKDARRFSYSTDSLSARVTSEKEFGNFRSFISFANWIKVAGQKISKVGLKDISETITSDVEINSLDLLEIDGENATTLTFQPTGSNTAKLILENVVIKNTNLVFYGLFQNRITLTNSKLINCTITSTYPNTSTSTVTKTITLNEKSQLIDCSFSDQFIESNPAIGSTSIFIDGNDVTISGCTFNAGLKSELDKTMDFIVCSSKENITITNNSISGSYKRFVSLTNCSNVNVSKNNILLNFDVATYVSDFSFTNISSIGAIIELLVSDDCSNIDFSGNYFSNTEQSGRLAFIGVTNTALTSTINNLNINDNTFYQSGGLSNIQDQLAAIYVVNKYVTTNATTNYFYVKNAKINNNKANNHQSIIISSSLHTDNKMYLRLVPINVEIDGNDIGNIGYCSSVGNKSSSTISYPMVFLGENSRQFNLRINNNNCHYIRLADATGKTIFVSSNATDAIGDILRNPTGDVIITNNIVNFIHVGNAYEANSSLVIENNSMPAYDHSYVLLDPFANSAFTLTIADLYYYSIFVGGLTPNYSPSGDPKNGFESNVKITGNKVYKGYWLNELGVSSNFNPKLYIRCDASAIIKDNQCRDTNENGYLVLIGAGNCIIESNKIFRGSQSVSGYMYWQNLIDGSVLSDTNPKTTLGIVTNNIFDSSTIDGTNDNLLKGNFPEKWIVNQNINQVEYSMFSFISESMYYSTGTTKNASKDPAVIISSLQTAQDDVESLITRITTANTDPKLYSVQINLANHLPTNVKIIGLQANIRKESGTLDAGSSFNIKLNKFTTTYSSPTDMLDVSSSAITNTTTDDPYFSSFEGSSISGTTFNGASAGANLTIIPNAANIISESYIINNASPVNLSFFARFTVSSGTLDMLISPIVVKYRW